MLKKIGMLKATGWLVLATALSAMTGPALGLADEAADGLALLEQNCLRCHATGPEGRSPHSQAPPFAEIASRYDPMLLAEALAEGIVTGHPDMPEFVFTSDQVEAIIAYLRTLR